MQLMLNTKDRWMEWATAAEAQLSALPISEAQVTQHNDKEN